MLFYTTLILPVLSGAGFANLTTAHIVGTSGIVLVTWLFLFAVHTVVARIHKVSMCPAVAPTVRWLCSWFFGGFNFIESFSQNVKHLFEACLGDGDSCTVRRGVCCWSCNGRHVGCRVFYSFNHLLCSFFESMSSFTRLNPAIKMKI